MTAEHRGGQNQHGAWPAPRTPRLFPADAQQTPDSMDRESPLAKNPRCHEPGAAGALEGQDADSERGLNVKR